MLYKHAVDRDKEGAGYKVTHDQHNATAVMLVGIFDRNSLELNSSSR